MATHLFEVAIAVKDLDAAATKYADILGVAGIPIKPEYFPSPGLKGVTFSLENAVISLVASDEPGTAVAGFLEARGEGVFLVGLEVPELEREMGELKGKGVSFVSETPIPYAAGKINFARPSSTHGVQLAFAQHTPDYWQGFIAGGGRQ